MKANVTGVHHIMITVGDIEEARTFYSDILGFEEMPLPGVITGPRAWFKLGTTELHVNEHPKHSAGNSHFAISVEPGTYEAYCSKRDLLFIQSPKIEYRSSRWYH